MSNHGDFNVLYEANTSESSVFPVPLFDLKVDDVKVGMVNFLFEHFFFLNSNEIKIPIIEFCHARWYQIRFLGC